MMSNIGLPENQKLILEFVESCRVRGLKSSSLRTHRRLLSGIEKYIRFPFRECTEYDWRMAIEKRGDEMGWTKYSVWQANSSVRAICRWMLEARIISKQVIRRRPGGTGRPAAANISEMLPECDTSDPEQIVEYRGRSVSMLALAALWLAMADGFLARCAFLGDGERQAARNAVMKLKKKVVKK
jgi:hypothetical protein